MDDNKRKSPIISLEKLLQKEHEFVSLEDALQDVVPPQWSADVLNGKKRVIIDCPESEEFERIFQHVPVLGDLYLEHEFYNHDEPVLFTCIDRRGIRYLCSCCYLGYQWVLSETTSGLLTAMIENSLTLREIFQKSNTCYFLRRTEVGYTITEDIPHDSLPRKGEYLDLEDEKNSAFYTELCTAYRNLIYRSYTLK